MILDRSSLTAFLVKKKKKKRKKNSLSSAAPLKYSVCVEYPRRAQESG